ncbi:cytidine deaminase-like protein [Conidiobolus coronatus NRRL 28638]|uniref:Cytidine deaminase-like protein n=1 Tax=Conidiobolus coronatus (strain ATCC 28846 / CBS 209.66 / NRRL 28638) TaxID=796925 RepID=A0A137P4U7_CONC2|nr:cytidine deaminase-like protein [Conidiobolus coronatus NRRL 28638]|eukprot:KXN70040.1 cytidine deaminase-like protein [Conidiobolus coronatus NRRL 28638]
MTSTITEEDNKFMELCIELAGECIPVESAYNVGAVLVKDGKVLSTGYSRELPGNTHAEECCYKKLSDPQAAIGATIYTTMEPCSKRLSGLTSCTERTLEAGVKRVVIGVKEPKLFVNCEGTQLLKEKGLVISYLEGFEEKCLKVNSHLNI